MENKDPIYCITFRGYLLTKSDIEEIKKFKKVVKNYLKMIYIENDGK